MVKALGEKGLNIVTKETTQKADEELLRIIADGAGKMPRQKNSAKKSKAIIGLHQIAREIIPGRSR
jgi:hypothetical protein